MRTRFSPSCLVVAALAAIVTLPLAVVAQVSYEVAPYVGLYLPLGAMLQAWPPSPGFSGSGQTVTQRTSLALGGHVTAWLSHRVGLEGTLSYAPSGVNMTCGGNGCARDGRVLVGSVKVVMPLTFVGILRAVHVGGGIGVVDHGGPAYKSVSGTTSAAPTVGAGVALRVAGSTLLRVDAEDSWFRSQLGYQNSCVHVDAVCRAVESSMLGSQHDLILSVGLGFRGL